MWCLGDFCRQCYDFNNLGHICAYSAILRLKIINNESNEAIELSKIPCDICARVALSEVIPRTDFGRGDVVQRSPISRSYLGYWAYRIYVGEWSYRCGYIDIFIYLYISLSLSVYIYIYTISSGGGRRLPVKLCFFSFFISHSQHCLKIYV